MPVALSWGGYVDTDLELTELLSHERTLSLYVMPQFPFAAAGPVLTSKAADGTAAGWFRLGQGGFVWEPARCAAGGDHAVAGSGSSEYLVDAENPHASAQLGWRLCLNCHGLFFAGHGLGVCSAGSSGHRLWQPVEYRVLKDVTPADLPGRHIQTGWRWCQRCQQLIRTDTPGACPAGGVRDSTGSGDYAVRIRPSSDEAGLHDGWQRCQGCGGLMYGGTGTSIDVVVGGTPTNFRRQLLRRGMWHHLALVNRQGRLHLSVDGRHAGSAAVPAGPPPGSSLRLGRTTPSRVTARTSSTG